MLRVKARGQRNLITVLGHGAMIAASEKLASGFPYARVDLYQHQERIYFGKITHYPEAGLGIFDPPEFDRALGDLWLHDEPIPERYYAT